jgi:uncharacterized protein (TIGR03435 family)
MLARYLLPLSLLTVASAFGQVVDAYGPVAAHLKAGDPAPEIQFTKILSAPGGEPWSPSILAGKLTILTFFLDTSRNPQTITMWNSLVDEFARPVQFLFVSGDDGSSLLPWLRQHPFKGWVFHDPSGKTGKAYGLKLPVSVFVGADERILGFGKPGFPPEESDVKAVLEGRVTTTRPPRASLKAYMESRQVLDPEPRGIPRAEDYRPKFAPSYALHVTPSEDDDAGNFSGDDFKALKGYTLKEAILNLYDVNPVRIILPATFDDGRRYDFSMVLPGHEDSEAMKARFEDGLLNYFHLTALRETRTVQAYVVTALPGREPAPLKPTPEGAMGKSSRVQFETVSGAENELEALKPQRLNRIRGVWIDGTADEFCHTLENLLDHPVVNETNLHGEFRFRVESSKGTSNNFLKHLRDQLGLEITTGNRDVEFLTFLAR